MVQQGTGPPVSELIERWLGGDRGAGDEICRRYYDRARAFGLKLTGNEADAEDIAQTALAAGLEGIKSGSRPDRFTGWLFGIARHVAVREWRRESRQRRLDGAPTSSTRSQEGAITKLRPQLDRVLSEALREMGDSERELLRVRFEEGLTREETAAKLGMGKGTFDRRWTSILMRLREAVSRRITTSVLLPGGMAQKRTSARWDEIEKLRPSFRAVIEMVHLEEIRVGDVATRLRVPLQTVEARLRYAYKQLHCGPLDDWSEARLEYRRRKEASARI